MSSATPLLSVEDLRVSFRTEDGLVRAVATSMLQLAGFRGDAQAALDPRIRLSA